MANLLTGLNVQRDSNRERKLSTELLPTEVFGQHLDELMVRVSPPACSVNVLAASDCTSLWMGSWLEDEVQLSMPGADYICRWLLP